jgi:hypothetical protein
MARRRKEKPQLQFDFMIFPEGCRRACDVPFEECDKCGLGDMDHTVDFSFQDRNHLLKYGEKAYCQVCLKDYERLHPGTIAKMKQKEGQCQPV